ncbi:MAG: aldehyde dehydrogenase family protein [Chitinispirillaceae bacterium]|nr:aldehyde dehydrogenase family protein [Chitinispirillaceae bacterium]
MDVSAPIKRLQSHFATGATLPREKRIALLTRLHAAVTSSQRHLLETLRHDLGKGPVDAYTAEIGYVLSEIEYARKHVRSWMNATRVKTLLINRPGRSYYYSRPYGCACIIGPWNYPFALTFAPLAAAIAAGNCVIIKPSEYAPATAACIAEMISTSFDDKEVTVVTGGPDETQKVIAGGVDVVFFTGGTLTGKSIMRTAAETLTPVVLELGGKNPCIVDRTAHIPEAARRIVWGKFLNAGQTCMAPDFVCVHEAVADPMRKSLSEAVTKMYGTELAKSPAYGRIINARHLNRIRRLLEGHAVFHGGTMLPEERYIEPTLVSVDRWDSPLMREEIFGPVLPVISYRDPDQLIAELQHRPSPLAYYCFTTDNRFKRIIEQRAKCGTICFNGTAHALITRDLPFGGIGASGMGRYHGKAGFDAFSYTRSILDKHSRKEFTALYPPHSIKVSLLSKMRRFLM